MVSFTCDGWKRFSRGEFLRRFSNYLFRRNANQSALHTRREAGPARDHLHHPEAALSSENAEPDRREPVKPETSEKNRAVVLIVDDHTAIRRVVSWALSLKGYESK
jgi:PleD family two-component response regulator